MSRFDNAEANANKILSCLIEASRVNRDRATFLQAKAEECTSNFMKMSYLAETAGLLQANVNIHEQLKKEGLLDL